MVFSLTNRSHCNFRYNVSNIIAYIQISTVALKLGPAIGGVVTFPLESVSRGYLLQ